MPVDCFRWRRAIAVAVAICGAVLLAPVSTPADESTGGTDLQSIVDRLLVEYELPGISVAVAGGDGEISTAVAGYADVEQETPVTADTGFFIGSVSKNIFGTIALMFVDRGLMTLDDPLTDHVAWPGGEDVTVRMLLNHTSGIPEYLDDAWFAPAADGGIPEFFRTRRGPRELMATLPDCTPAFVPGSRQEYSNTNGLLVGEILREVSGKPLAGVFDEMIVEPLGLQRTYLYGVSTAGRDRARGYSGAAYWGATAGNLADCSPADDALPDAADGSIVACARDLLRYHRALRSGELLESASWAAMTRVEPGIGNGLAYMVVDGPFGPVRGNLGRSMGHVAANLYYVEHDTYVVMMINRSDAALPLKPLLEALFDDDR